MKSTGTARIIRRRRINTTLGGQKLDVGSWKKEFLKYVSLDNYFTS